MRLLFDEQFAESLCQRLADLYPASLHIRLLGLGGAADLRVWDLAREHGCLLVSKDEDFHRLSLLRGAPPKLIWVRLGNCTTAEIENLLRRRHDDIRQFSEHNEATVLELG